ncbi:hypothetical protein V8C37DRAFT_246868 [Trichoderma ceciliae]
MSFGRLTHLGFQPRPLLTHWLEPLTYRQAVLHCIKCQGGFRFGKLCITFPTTHIGGILSNG